MRVRNAAHGMRLLVLRTQSKKLNSLDQAGGVSHDGVKVVGAVVVDEAEGDLDALRIDEI